jgi:hypothetical protein
VAFKKVFKVISRILSTNKNVKALNNFRFREAVKPDLFSPQDLAFLHRLIEFMYS